MSKELALQERINVWKKNAKLFREAETMEEAMIHLKVLNGFSEICGVRNE